MFILVGSVKRLSSIFFSHNFDIFLCYGKLLHFWRSLAWCLVMHEWKWFKSETYKVSGCLSWYCGPVGWQYWVCLNRNIISWSEWMPLQIFYRIIWIIQRTPVCCKITEGKVGDGYVASSKWKPNQGLSIEGMEEFFTFLVK